MKIKETESKPESGQFVAVWIYNDQIWSGTFRWIYGILYEWEDSKNDFAYRCPGDYPFEYDPKYFILGE